MHCHLLICLYISITFRSLRSVGPFGCVSEENTDFYPVKSAILSFYLKKYILRIPAASIHIWESQLCSVSV